MQQNDNRSSSIAARQSCERRKLAGRRNCTPDARSSQAVSRVLEQRCSWPMEQLQLHGGEKKVDGVGHGEDPKANPDGAHIPRDCIAHVVMMLMFDFGRR